MFVPGYEKITEYGKVTYKRETVLVLFSCFISLTLYRILYKYRRMGMITNEKTRFILNNMRGLADHKSAMCDKIYRI